MLAPMDVSGGTWRHALDGMSRLAMLGRDAELELLEAALRGTVTTSALVTGEPGIGKTRLCLEVLRRAEELRCIVLAGAGSPATQGLALAPMAEALGRFLDSVSAAGRAELDGLDDLGLFLTRQSFPEHHGVAAALDWTRLFDAVARLLERAAGSRPLVMFVDNLQWADRRTLQLLDFLGRRLAGTSVLILLAGRPESAFLPSPVRSVRPDWTSGLAG